MITDEECIKRHAKDLKCVQFVAIILIILSIMLGITIGLFIGSYIK